MYKSLLEQNDRYSLNSILGYSHQADIYILGYKSTCELIIKEGIEHGNIDALIYPYLFNYHHYVELSLKRAQALCNAILNRNSSYEHEHIHDLRKLWASCKKKLDKIDSSYQYRNIFSIIDSATNELTKVTKNGFFGRYEVNQKNIKYESPKCYINFYSVLENFKQVSNKTDRLLTWLDSIHDYSLNP